jgi:hypothetical protein
MNGRQLDLQKSKVSKPAGGNQAIVEVQLPATNHSHWTVHDDHLLIESMQHCPDVKRISIESRFSRPFSHHEVMERWTAVLTDVEISRYYFINFRHN